ncbi:hypothetical protein BOH78_2412 [Pichia kudriavzevii]|uniref:Uncharacterized protein n=1 Tax=Pichia kudriavzevii TaxID=4909 RepID=A0A1V2LMI8_PICKU|nr:hypothetical protein BOH78_2412 [Pichia kudriavzevii]
MHGEHRVFSPRASVLRVPFRAYTLDLDYLLRTLSTKTTFNQNHTIRSNGLFIYLLVHRLIHQSIYSSFIVF